ncbi:MAG TPA: FHA domain-containing protein [Lacipirellulaceae bacterium]|jgi:pSer/pThr/pTyr-binding forkhead associated (FHA) protein
MELKLIVLAGAKEGTQIPLKKEKFIIGRASECTLRAGSEAISRRHCAIVRANGAWVASDLGSRNGTYLNDQKIEAATPLAVGDELRVGPLKFRVEEYVKRASENKVLAPELATAAAATTDEPQDINRAKQPPVKNIAEVIERTVSKADGSMSEDDVSRWLLNVADVMPKSSTRETRTLSMEETTTLGRQVTANSKPIDESVEEIVADTHNEQEIANGVAATNKPDSGSGGWSFFKKVGAKKKPGKLPPRPAEASKDSREAAADILREMTRRR